MLSALVRNPLATLLFGLGLLVTPTAAAPLKAVAEYAVTMGGTHPSQPRHRA